MIGKTISHYRIVEKLGGRGMGIVYRAHDTTLDREVAIYVLPDVFAGDPERYCLCQSGSVYRLRFVRATMSVGDHASSKEGEGVSIAQGHGTAL